MKVFAGRYSWDGKKHDNQEPIAWFPGTYNLKIFNISSSNTSVKHLKPYICIYSKTGEGVSISSNPEKFAKHICSDFSIDFEKVLWAEEVIDNSGEFEVIVFSESGRLGENYFYRTEKRRPLVGEKKLIEKELADLK
ncbi:hypothetical protein [Desulfosediminicola flagellatus]|uniref:hypothetical protein n=1 Tax=Desulfosediminicola flagellatus TaxID=2569541 RepID=UPI0010ACA882|nr:hypothetical protein [Desulfosediminicola flagellatus]